MQLKVVGQVFAYRISSYSCRGIKAWKFHIVYSLSFPLCNENLNNFLPWILAALQLSKKNSCRGNYMRKYGIWPKKVKFKANIKKSSIWIQYVIKFFVQTLQCTENQIFHLFCLWRHEKKITIKNDCQNGQKNRILVLKYGL